ncbi:MULTISPECIES: recombinase family protein [unclassified Pseudomonas]|uniref:recombinase family protein n=1 Tax=unclassified Pseudomonas TaxID=196821 RepID=UPI0018677CAB|nr:MULTISPECIES: recombinase family protein [unclassified Pseudomonas]
MRVVAYYRVSTGAQEKSGLGLEAQVDYVHSAARQQGWEIVAEYTETVSGTVTPQDRPECKKALAHGLPLLVAKLDRIGRDVGHIADLMKRTSLKVATMPLADNFQLHLFAALAEQERSFIASRTKDALKALQDRADSGCAESVAKVARRSETLARGRTPTNRAKAGEAVQQRVTTWLDTVRDPIDLCIRKGARTLPQVAQCLSEKGVPTSRGGEWSPMQVKRVMAKLSLSF